MPGRFYKITLALLILVPSTVMSFQALEDSIFLYKVSETCKRVRVIQYDVYYDRPGVNIRAEIVSKIADVHNVGLGKALIKARGTLSLAGVKKEFQFSYDGEVFKFMPEKGEATQVLKDPEIRAVGRTLGLDYYNLTNKQYGASKGIEHLLDYERLKRLPDKEVNGKALRAYKIWRKINGPNGTIHTESIYYFDPEYMLPAGGEFKSLQKIYTIKSFELEAKYDKQYFDISSVAEEVVIDGNQIKAEGLPNIGAYIPDFNLEDIEGKMHQIPGSSSKLILLDFWGTWCAPCIKSMPGIQAIYKEFQAQGLAVYGVTVNDSAEKVQRFLSQNEYTYTFFPAGTQYAIELKLSTFPTVILVDNTGRVLHAEMGVREGMHEDLKRIIRSKLK